MSKTREATFAAGCFWGPEKLFRELAGVINAEVGYAGGRTENPTYEQVCAGETGHAESVHIKYDPDVVTYEQLLEKFWEIHDPTQINRQGPDKGSQYRSVIFFHNQEQKNLAEKSKKELEESGTYDKPIATEILTADSFYRAEEYHQRYFEKHNMKVCH